MATTTAAPPPRLRPTRRGRRAAVAAGLVAGTLVVAVAVVAVRYLGVPDRWVPGWLAGPVCTVATDDGDLGVDPADARALTTFALADAATDPLRGTAPARGRASDALDAAVADGRLTDTERTAALEALRTRDGALTCRLTGDERAGRDGLIVEEEGPRGLTPRADAVRRALRTAGGDLPLGGFEPGGVSSGHMAGSAHYEGRAVDVFFRPVSAETSRQGWLLAQWLVAHAGTLDVQNVIYADRIWNASTSSSGWKPYVPPGGPTRDPVLRHLDHVHVDVPRGN